MSIPSRTGLEDFSTNSEVTVGLVNLGFIWYFLYVNRLAGMSPVLLPKTGRCRRLTVIIIPTCWYKDMFLASRSMLNKA